MDTHLPVDVKLRELGVSDLPVSMVDPRLLRLVADP